MTKWIVAGLALGLGGCSLLGGGTSAQINPADVTNIVACGAQLDGLASTIRTQIPACFAAVSSIKAQNGK